MSDEGEHFTDLVLPQPGEVYALMKLVELAQRYGIHPGKTLISLALDDVNGGYVLRFNDGADDAAEYSKLRRGFTGVFGHKVGRDLNADEKNGVFYFADNVSLIDAITAAIEKAPPERRPRVI